MEDCEEAEEVAAVEKFGAVEGEEAAHVAVVEDGEDAEEVAVEQM